MSEISDVLRRALALIQDRGWSPRFSHGPGTPLNIRSAVSAACSELTLTGVEFYPLYTKAVFEVAVSLGEGITSWETSTGKRHQSEAEYVLGETITRLESHAEVPANSVRTGAV